MQQDNDINNWLKGRAAPKAPGGLAERIIHAAVMQPRPQKAAGFSAWWNDVLSMFALPHPSVALATVLVLGLALGVQASDGLTVLQQDWSSFLYINEGGWL